jgi:chorismate mutase/prephenate dehydratase
MSSPDKPRIGFLRPARLTNGYTAAARFAAHLCGHLGAIDSAFTPVPFASHAEVIAAQARGDIDFGVIAIENTLDGIIVESVKDIERLFEAPSTRRTFVVWEELLPIQHFLMTQSGNLDGVEAIRSHHSALRQCSKVLQRLKDHLNIRVEQAESTGAATVEAAGDATIAAIASREALDVYAGKLRAVDLAALDREHQLGFSQTARLSDYSNGFTRFWVLGGESHVTELDAVTPSGAIKTLHKTCFLFSLPNETGTLHEALSILRVRNIFLSIIYPFPRVERDFEYMFFVEVEGHLRDASVQAVMEEINTAFPQRPDSPPSCIWLGSFPNTELLKQHPAHQKAFRDRYYPQGVPWND